ncbi:toll/interleukin-1 receptor domain-containing protein [Sphingomonas nostoxanthinifaciens]|uniref:toll/interleukin-1 receptor domain-containing protein n=1 Tax=Sphingomonas nostoxanthinifaciens TaxID=2872652 RepID=UPI001CC20220|nr:toll/interleukin-1 receptor domain-containing protein [Sphingomonas nostoxanthinifaciens]UAK24304.1 toll/interleukin-1 receptor domain-containing protein [Sphingomonas nostoxanthinifaciens]
MRIVLLYNELDKDPVRHVWRQLRGPGVIPWFAGEQIDAFGDLYDQIGAQIAQADAVVFFIGDKGLGKFQRNIELGSSLWRHRTSAGTFAIIVVAMSATAQIPPELAEFPQIDFDPVQAPATLAASIRRLAVPGVVA